MAIRPSGAPSRPWPRWLVPGLAALALAGVGIGLAVRQNQRHQAERTQQQQPLPRRIAALGRVEPLDRVVKLSVPASLSNDAVRELRVKEGQQVSKGQVLAVMDSAQSLDRSVREAQAAVQVAERKVTAQASVISRYRAELTQATVELRRYSQLYAQGASSAEVRDRRITIESTSRANLEQALSDEATLRAERDESRATLARDQAELAKATIRAPFGGTVFKINAYPGDKVGDEGILELGDSSRMGVIAEVYQTDRGGITLGQRAVISADGFPNKQMEGKVVEIARQVSRQSVFSGQAGENLDRRVFEVKIGLGPEAAAMASAINYLQVNVLFEPLTPEQQREQRQRLEQLVDQQRREQSGLSQPSPR
ncbi:efflux RND transporter periplasmic adaptor subunit [Cyanobium sp. T1G-Tous]|uniref:efflux RND transporter periplasmic adaptor subunit n=1 Tax=Cyanobium sp. T1G-Tous TaxID=2823722 RepID=UPI0020CF38F5|nr:efflux RND transporter periplasmic adaptor subunit [Cyanobium sp. T1G-Tous]MCP9803158.1 efflux RND transporter periplasmic adaptor subunit [Cyanobium sp. T1G-Tous]